MRARGGASLIDRSAEIVQVFQPALVAYPWRQGDTDKAGRFEAEFRVSYLDGTFETFPNLGFIEVFVTENAKLPG